MRKKFFVRGRALALAFVIFTSVLFGNAGVSASTAMRDISALDIVKEMTVGWNLGNTLDSHNCVEETGWGNPKTTKDMIIKVKEMGFNTIRIPVTWYEHTGSAPDYAIEEAWLKRAEEVVNYVLDNDMYAILNFHHEDEWLIPTSAKESAVKAQLVKMWEQVANRFKNYGDYLIFETMNEPRVVGSSTEWSGGTSEYRKVINNLNLAAVNTIRATGGNNLKRFIMCPTHGANGSADPINEYVIPNNDNRVIVSVHSYSPYYFCMVSNQTPTWGSDYEKSQLSSEFDSLYNKFVKNGIAVVIGEFGTIDKNNLSSREIHAEYYVKEAKKRGITCCFWDNGYYGAGKDNSYALLNRSALTWYYPTIAQALVRGAGVTPGNTQIPSSTPTNRPTNTPTKYIPSNTPTNNNPEDINGDNSINMIDVMLIAKHFNTSSSDSNFNNKCDINKDGSINMQDVIMLALKFNTVISATPSTKPSENDDSVRDGILYNGRFDFSDPAGPKSAWSGSNVELNFSGTEVSATINSSGANWFQAIIDGVPQTPFSVLTTTTTVKLATGLSAGNHHLVLWKRTEASQGEAQFKGFNFGSGKLLDAPTPLQRKIEFIGDSITCGYGNEGARKEDTFTPKNENSYLTYAAITARELNARANFIAWSGIGVCMNYGGASGTLMPERYDYTLPLSAVKWDFSKFTPQAVVINLGTNDFSTQTPDKTKFVTAYKGLISKVRSNYPDAHIFCTIGPMLWGNGLDTCRSNIKEAISLTGDSKVSFVEFPTQDGSNGYGEDWHPSLATHKLMADKLTKEIKTTLGW